MKLRKCENGHFYDEEKYAFCPHCKKETAMGEPDLTVAMRSKVRVDQEQKAEPLTEPSSMFGSSSEMKKEIRKIQKEQNLTVGYYTDRIGTEPVVGWLVCVYGTQKGKSFELYEGRNFIGRSSDMDVVLENDKTISRSKHAILIYEARKRVFLAQAGESRGLFYVNDEVVLSNMILKAYDELLIGNTRLLFVPFCGENFSWRDIAKEKN